MSNIIESESNNTAGSIEVMIQKHITFKMLWDNYPTEKVIHNIDGKGTDFSNHCAINVSHSLYKSGVLLKSFPKGRKCWGCPTPNEKGKGIHALAAQELADFLNKKPFYNCPVAQELTGNNYKSLLDNKKGVIFFKDYWQRSNEKGTDNRSGDHIDLWNDNVLASEGSAQSFLTQTLGLYWDGVYSDHKVAKEVLFWEI